MSVLVRYWAAAKQAAGVADESYAATDLASLLTAITDRHAGDGLAAVLVRCSYLVDEVTPGTTDFADVKLAPGSVVEVLPPFAGG